MSIYYDEIHRRANLSWQGIFDLDTGKPLITNSNFEQWKTHWITTAILWRENCLEHHLTKTAQHLEKIINDNI